MKKLHKIVITPSGWVYIEYDDGTEKGLGDIGVDVIIKTNTIEEQRKEDERTSAKYLIPLDINLSKKSKDKLSKFIERNEK